MRLPSAFVAAFLLLGTHDATLRQATSRQAAPSTSVITEASIRGHMEFLASDAMKGRGSGTEDEWRAAVYIGSQMRRWGIEPLGDNGGFVKQIETGRLTAPAASGSAADFKVETKPGYTWNAIGQLKGSNAAQAAEVILLTAHLDHLGANGAGPDPIFNGADDDASGSTAVLELAEALAKGPRPQRTVIFAWFGSEESGGAGASDFLAHPPVPLTQFIANLEFEMIANRDPLVPPHTLWLTGYDCSTLGPDLAKQGARIVGDPHPTEGFFGRSDNRQLAARGIVAQTVSSFDAVATKTYHKVTDEISTVDFAHMTDSIQSMLSPVLWLANSTYKPTWLPGKDPSKQGGSCGARPGRGGN